MRNTCLIGIICSFLLSCQAQPKYTFDGTVNGGEGNVYLLVSTSNGKVDTLKSAMIENGKFHMEGTVTEPVAAYLKIDNIKEPFLVFIENTPFSITLNVQTPQEYSLTGGRLQKIHDEYRAIKHHYEVVMDSLKKEYRICAEEKNLFGKMHVRALMADADSIYEKSEDQFILRNNNIVAASIVNQRVIKLIREKRLGDKYKLLGDSAQNSLQGKLIKEYLEKQNNSTVGMKATNFVQTTPEGEEISLYSIKAKVKIIDFWASWCGPCRAENPHMRALYAKYHSSGLEIIGVSLDSKKDAWVAAIEKDQLDWIHVSDLLGWENSVAKLCGIRAIPSTLVLDEDNTIIGVNLRGSELDECLENIFGKK